MKITRRFTDEDQAELDKWKHIEMDFEYKEWMLCATCRGTGRIPVWDIPAYSTVGREEVCYNCQGRGCFKVYRRNKRTCDECTYMGRK